MDELCDIFRRHSVICTDENNEKLIRGFHDTTFFLRGMLVVDGKDVNTHLQKCRQRYREYVSKVRFRGKFQYLENALQAFLSFENDYPSKTGMKTAQFEHLLMSYFIDGELLFAIGICHLEE